MPRRAIVAAVGLLAVVAVGRPIETAAVDGDPPPCDDGNPCTTDSCDPERHDPVLDGTPCPDGLFCNGMETCRAGICTPGSPLVVGDNNPCTIDSCDEQTGARFDPVPDGTLCSDGFFCNGIETCRAGICTLGYPPVVGDNNPCTIDSCDNQTGARIDPVPDGTPCSDRLFCNGMETCQRGSCTAGPAPNCDDGDPCTVDGCSSGDVCEHVPDPRCQPDELMPCKLLAVRAAPAGHSRRGITRFLCTGSFTMPGADFAGAPVAVGVNTVPPGIVSLHALAGECAALGDPPGSSGYGCRGKDGLVLIKPTLVKARLGFDLLAETGASHPYGAADVAIQVVMGSSRDMKRYCARFGGAPASKDTATLYSRTDAPAPGACSSGGPVVDQE
jgi:hypothetical protein